MVMQREENDRAQKYRRVRTMSCTLIDSGRAGGEWGEEKTLAETYFLWLLGKCLRRFTNRNLVEVKIYHVDIERLVGDVQHSRREFSKEH